MGRCPGSSRRSGCWTRFWRRFAHKTKQLHHSNFHKDSGSDSDTDPDGHSVCYNHGDRTSNYYFAYTTTYFTGSSKSQLNIPDYGRQTPR